MERKSRRRKTLPPLSEGQLEVLNYIERNGPSTGRQIRGPEERDNPKTRVAVHQRLKQLEGRGLVVCVGSGRPCQRVWELTKYKDIQRDRAQEGTPPDLGMIQQLICNWGSIYADYTGNPQVRPGRCGAQKYHTRTHTLLD
jgi:hypothetical protein